MTFIQTVPPEGGGGPVPNYEAAFSLRPEAYAAWRGLVTAIRSQMDPRRYELASVAAARRLRCSYCMLAHGAILADEHLPAETVRALAGDHHAAGLDEVDVAVMDLADKIAGDATAVTPADMDRLRDLGLSDAEILDVVLAATARCFFAKTLDALGAEADHRFAGLEPGLRDALTVGRPISSG
jgi:uncharacterized peroxidase-related enzyme